MPLVFLEFSCHQHYNQHKAVLRCPQILFHKSTVPNYCAIFPTASDSFSKLNWTKRHATVKRTLSWVHEDFFLLRRSHPYFKAGMCSYRYLLFERCEIQLVSVVADLSSLKSYQEMITKSHGLILWSHPYICSPNAFLFPCGMVRTWKSEGQIQLEYLKN